MKHLLFAILFFSITSTTWARPPHGDKKDPQQHLAMLEKKLELTADQVSMLKPIVMQVHQKHEEVRDMYQLDDAHAAIKQVHEDARSEFAKILTSEQLAKLDEMRKKRRHGPRHDQQQSDTTKAE